MVVLARSAVVDVPPGRGREELSAGSAEQDLEPAGLPPALVVTMEIDPNRDEAEAYAGQLTAAGVRAEVVRVPGLVHASLNMSAYVPRSAEILQAVVTFLGPHLVAPDQEVGDRGRARRTVAG